MSSGLARRPFHTHLNLPTNRMELNLFFAIKLGIFLGLFSGFAVTSFGVFKSYLSEQTMISSRIESYSEGQDFPDIIICNKTSYKKVKTFVSESEYIENTLKLEDFFVSFHEFDTATKSQLLLDYTIIPLNTIFNGRCYIIRVNVKVKMEDMLLLKINTKQNLKVFLLEPEQRILIASGVTRELPTVQDIGHEDGMMDFGINTVIQKWENKCQQYDTKTGRSGKFLKSSHKSLSTVVQLV